MKTPLTEGIQNIIIATQDYKKHLISYHSFVLEDKQFDWYEETKNFYNSLPLPNEMATSINCFESVLSYPIQDTIETEMDELPLKYEFGY